MKLSDTFEFIIFFFFLKKLLNLIPFEHKYQQTRQNPNPIRTLKKITLTVTTWEKLVSLHDVGLNL